ncbi:hypothetical protein [Roseomonas sp. AR75]|uniref:hypothetical protein n=1 Tax=Roseomonas sp. AR75 TaxID=2562311 RepID=UPI0010C12F14|nr:hypothetical protein [Roseomonas sp. AR75]
MSSERSPIPEVQLAAAVIRRALDDALTPTDRLARTHLTETADGPRHSVSSGVTAREREEAVRFLLDTSERWSQSRATWCDAAGLDPDILVRHAMRQIPAAAIPIDIRLARRLAAPAAAMREAA